VVRYLGTGNELPLGHYGLGVRGATALAAALKVNKSLSVLRLADNHLGGVGCKLILEALRTNPGATVRTPSAPSPSVSVPSLPAPVHRRAQNGEGDTVGETVRETQWERR
jgi:hypothetical protein